MSTLSRLNLPGYPTRPYDPRVAEELLVLHTVDQLRGMIELLYPDLVAAPIPPGLSKLRKAELAMVAASLLHTGIRKPPGQTSTLYPKSRRKAPTGSTRKSRREYTKNLHRQRWGTTRQLLGLQ